MNEQIALLVAQVKLQIAVNQNNAMMITFLCLAVFALAGACIILGIENNRRSAEIQKLRDWAGLPDTRR